MAIAFTSTSTFDTDVLKKEGVVFVDFYANWCGPCKMTEPIVEELSQSPNYKDVNFVKVDVDAHNELAARYNVLSIPTFMIFKKGRVVSQFIGARDKAFFEREIKLAL
ncbi:thioredoxin [Candidatus Roizmanbacteria bacterium RIFCSPHIGHO2_01_FULL_39_12b]|uniref:Thioredoxin n=1 Tax=Candidatus Roizmanbacteria bacterium RIFCSPHIGHO2_01_FULL_39_12b TaxID=1802030 RepID=A0A1F7G8F1_9BACT|nr:MAG: thioredoxin [Candidatus Roizmanbacteria bacterium RIFCSPHIGHO2_01_FULL_39_12b]